MPENLHAHFLPTTASSAALGQTGAVRILAAFSSRRSMACRRKETTIRRPYHPPSFPGKGCSNTSLLRQCQNGVSFQQCAWCNSAAGSAPGCHGIARGIPAALRCCTVVTVANACRHNRKQRAKGLLRKPSTAQAFCSPKSSRLAEHELRYKETPEDVSQFLLPLAACSILTTKCYWCARAVCPSSCMGCQLGTDSSSATLH